MTRGVHHHDVEADPVDERSFGPALHLEVARAHRHEVRVVEAREVVFVAEEEHRPERRHERGRRVGVVHRRGDDHRLAPPVRLCEVDHRQIRVLHRHPHPQRSTTWPRPYSAHPRHCARSVEQTQRVVESDLDWLIRLHTLKSPRAEGTHGHDRLPKPHGGDVRRAGPRTGSAGEHRVAGRGGWRAREGGARRAPATSSCTSSVT